jgi:NADPH:quinone reductase-like Zn-dependent oxidoreductase
LLIRRGWSEATTGEAGGHLRDRDAVVPELALPQKGGHEPNRDQLLELGAAVDGGELRAEIDSVFELEDARAAFERSLATDKRGKVVIRVAPD